MFPRLRDLFKKFEKPLMVLAGSAGLTALLLNLDFNLLEANLYDLRVVRGLQQAADPRIVLVSIDDSTAKLLDEFPPFPMDLHAKFMESLERLDPRGVGYLVDLNQVNQSNPDLLQTEWGTRFVSAANRLQAKGATILLGTPFDVTGEVLPPYPLSSLPHSIAVIHKDGNVFAEDKITRRALVQLGDKPVFHVELAQKLGLSAPDTLPRGSFPTPEVDSQYFFFRYHGPTAAPAEPYERVSFSDVLRGSLPEGHFKNKIVLVSTVSKNDSSDFVYTPYSKQGFSTPKLVVHANILDSIIHDDGIVRAPTWMNWTTTFIMISLVLWWVLNLTPLYGVFSTLGLGLVFVVFGHAMFQLNGFWLRESQPLVGIFVGYYLVVPYRLILEYKKRWDYQRKNELLTQVEELKTNFMSLVTHDLKTPVARIQGLAEVLLSKASDRLITRDQETLHNIIAATDELNRFISSILELSKVESGKLHLMIESKDVNTIIERSVDLFKAQARARRIRLTLSLEPLFPIRLDAQLIQKVINNLVDNAMKYSPTSSEVRVETREDAGHVVISVTDQGIGMTPEERDSLFQRFYRAKNDTTTKITGTGLGLYLTKYFVEAHAGRMEVESVKGSGSTFRIFLPLDGAPALSPVFAQEMRDTRALEAASPERGPGLRVRLRGILAFNRPKAVVAELSAVEAEAETESGPKA